MSNFPCSLTRNITSVKDLARTQVKDDYITNSHSHHLLAVIIIIIIQFLFNSFGESILSLGVKGFNPFTPESDQCPLSPAASPAVSHHTV